MNPPWKLVSYSDGKLSPIKETVTKFKKNVSESSMRIPISFICVTGEAGSGKSFYTNLLINYLQQGCSVNSLVDFANSVSPSPSKPLNFPGFSFGNCNSDQLFQVDENEPSGVYVWPKPFYLRKYHGFFILWILHLHYKAGSDEERQFLSYFVHLVCSRVITIALENDKKPALTSHFDFLQNADVNCKIQFQKSKMYINRTNLKPFQILTATPDTNSKPELSPFNPVITNIENSPYLSNYKCISFTNLPNFQTPLHDEMGCLTLCEDAYWKLDQVVKLMGEPNLIWPNLYKTTPLDSNCVSSFFRECAKIVNRLPTSISAYNNPVDNETQAIISKTDSTTEILQKSTPVLIPDRKIHRSSPVVNKTNTQCVAPAGSGTSRETKYNNLYTENADAPVPSKNRQSFTNLFGSLRKKKGPEKRLKTLLNIASTEFEQKMHRNYIELLTDNLHETSEKYLGEIFYKSIDDAIRTLKIPYNLSDIDVDKLGYSIKHSRASIYYEYLSKHKLILQYNTSVISHVNSYMNYPSGIEVDQMLTNAHFSISRKVNISSKGVVADACEKLQCFYLQQLKTIVSTEKLILKDVIAKLIDSYKTSMNETISGRHFNPSQLSKIHCNFCSKYINILELCKSGKHKYIGNVTNCFQELKVLLEFEFQSFREENRSKLQKLYKDIESLLTSQKKLYCDEIEQAIKLEVSESILKEKHNSLLKNLKLGLESELSVILGTEQPSQLYWKALDSHIVNKYWKSFKHKPEPKIPVPLRNDRIVEASVNRKELMTPIIFHLSLKQVGVSIHDTNQVQRISNIPLIVGVTTQGQWVYGNHIKNSTRSRTPGFQYVWNVGDLLSGKKPSSRELKKVIGETESLVTTEILLGFLFTGLKQQIEKQFKGSITTGIIIVPFWFTSYQRQQVIQAGKIASFNETEIINENSAIACYAAQRLLEEKQNYDVFVISENSDIIDATAYNIDIAAGVIRMVGHCSNTDINRISVNNDHLVAHACKKVLRQCKPFLNSATQPRMVFLSHESANWSEILYSASNIVSNAINGDVSGWETDLGTLGAAMYCQNETLVLQEWISTPILFATNSLEYVFFSKKPECYLPSRGKELPVSNFLPKKTSQARFYQRAFNGNRKTVIGLLSMSRAQSRCKLEVIINHQGIMSFSNLVMENTRDTFTWTATNISEAQVFQHADKINKMLPDNCHEDSCEENKSQIDLINKFQDIQNRIANGEGRFHSDIGRQMALEQIQNELKLLSSPISKAKLDILLSNYATIKAKHFY